jgi:serine/threonine-protein kinase
MTPLEATPPVQRVEADAPAPTAGDVIAVRYRLDRLIGEGGMGVVWAATHTVTGKPVALKLVRKDTDPRLFGRVFREARAACAVKHPNVIPIHDVLQLEDGSPVMVMDLLSGETLGERLRRTRRLSLQEASRILAPVASAVGTAHALGIVHRDLKPDNIFLATDTSRSDLAFDVKVLDFGIAKMLPVGLDAPAVTALTATGSFIGTPYYMSPEQVFNEKDIDHRADVWSLGVIIYEALAGTRPTEGDGLGQVLKMITTTDIRPLETAAPDVPADVARLVGQMLRRNREERPDGLHEVAALLSVHGECKVPTFGVPTETARRQSERPPPMRAAASLSPMARSSLELAGTLQVGQTADGLTKTPTTGLSKAPAADQTQVPSSIAKHPRRRAWLVPVGAAAAVVVGVGVYRLAGTPADAPAGIVATPAATTTGDLAATASSVSAPESPDRQAVASPAFSLVPSSSEPSKPRTTASQVASHTPLPKPSATAPATAGSAPPVASASPPGATNTAGAASAPAAPTRRPSEMDPKFE